MKLSEYPKGIINGFDGLRVVVDLDKEHRILTLSSVNMIPSPVAEAATKVIECAKELDFGLHMGDFEWWADFREKLANLEKVTQ